MNYNLTTQELAYDLCLELTGLSSGDLIHEYLVDSERDFDLFWERNEDRLETLNVREIRICGFHIVGSLDDCEGIRQNGLRNLQYVLSNDTTLSNELRSCGVTFDIENRLMYCDGRSFCIDFERYRGRNCLGMTNALATIARRVFYDHCVNGFLYNDDVEHYGTGIHKRPEVLGDLGRISKKLEELDASWASRSKSYAVHFYATLDQIPRFQFSPLKSLSSIYRESDMPLIKKWLMFWAIDRAFNPDHTQGELLYIQDDAIISPKQITNIVPLPECVGE